jgi:hypothetical protein
MGTRYAVFNTKFDEVVRLPEGASTTENKEVAKDWAKTLNARGILPEYQNFTVITVTFDPEV